MSVKIYPVFEGIDVSDPLGFVCFSKARLCRGQALISESLANDFIRVTPFFTMIFDLTGFFFTIYNVRRYNPSLYGRQFMLLSYILEV